MDAPGGLGGCSASVLGLFGINSTRMPSTRPNHTSFYTQTTINIFLICCLLILDVNLRFGGGRILTHFGTSIADFIKGK